MTTKLSQLDVLKQKKAQLNARIQKIEAAQKSKSRKEDTRRKIIAGAYAIDQAKKDGKLEALYRKVKAYCIRDSDRALFE